MPMIRHNDEPGSQAWLQRRLGSFNASDAPAMLGCSTNKTRTQLLNQIYTSIQPEFSDYVQERVLDRGHRIEHFMRAIAAEIMDEDDLDVIGGSLAVPGLSRPLGASLDGRAILGKLIWECKSINDELRANLHHDGRDSAERNDGRKLHKMYRVQMEQQLMVDESAERTLFTAAAVDRDGSITEERHCWYESDPALRAEILAGWKQFDADLAAYVPEKAKAAPVVATPVEMLPAVSMRVDGQLAIVSNLAIFGTALRNFIQRIPEEPSTDQEFADTEAACKKLKQAEDELGAAEDHALAQLADVNDMRRLVAEYKALARTTRLQREKLVTFRKEQIRGELVEQGKQFLASHVAKLNIRLGKDYMPTIQADFGGVIKGKRTVDSLRDAVNTELARAKIAANEIADKIQINLGTLRELAIDHAFLFADTPTIVQKAPDDLTVLVKSRIAEHKAKEEAKLEAQREQIRREEQERAEEDARTRLAEANSMLMSEIDGISQQEIIAIMGRAGVRKGGTIECIRETLAETEAWPVTAEHFGVLFGSAQMVKDRVLAKIQQMLLKAEAKEAERVRQEELLRNAPATNDDIAQAVEQGELAAPLAQDIQSIQDDLTSAAVSNHVISTAQRTAASAPATVNSPATLLIGAINAQLGYTVTAAFLAELGFNVARIEGARRYYRDTDMPAIGRAIAQHTLRVTQLQHA